MIKKNLLFVSKEFIENKKRSLKAKDSVVNISNILAKKMNIKLMLKILVTLLKVIRQYMKLIV